MSEQYKTLEDAEINKLYIVLYQLGFHNDEMYMRKVEDDGIYDEENVYCNEKIAAKNYYLLNSKGNKIKKPNQTIHSLDTKLKNKKGEIFTIYRYSDNGNSFGLLDSDRYNVKTVYLCGGQMLKTSDFGPEYSIYEE